MQEDIQQGAASSESGQGAQPVTGILADPVDSFSCPACSATIDVKGIPAFSSVTCDACGQTASVPAKLGGFLLLRLIGAGGMGGVYFARDEQLGRDVAIKVMLQSLGDDPQFIETFRREAQAVAKLNHSNIAQIYSFGQEKGQPYIVMELVSGERVDELMEQPGGLAPLQTLSIGLEIAQGLSAADEAGLVHGDIKPENILLDRKGRAKLVDFGLATVAHQNAGDGIWGTPYYIAPEKIKRQKLDARSDIYSLGATLYHMLTGHPPFEGETPVEVVKARLDQPPPDPREHLPDLPPIVSEVITRMLATERTERYPNYRSLISDMRKTIQAFDSIAATAPDKQPIKKGIRIKKRRPAASSGSVADSLGGTENLEARPGGKRLVIRKDSGGPSIASAKRKPVSKTFTSTQDVEPKVVLSDEEREARRKKRQKAAKRMFIVLLVVVLVVATGAGIYAYVAFQRTRIEERRERYELRVIQRGTDEVLADIQANRERIVRIQTQAAPLHAAILEAAERMQIPIKPPQPPEPEQQPELEQPEAEDADEGAAEDEDAPEAAEGEKEAKDDADEDAENPDNEDEPPPEVEEAEPPPPDSPEVVMITEAIGAELALQRIIENTARKQEDAQELARQIGRSNRLAPARRAKNELLEIQKRVEEAVQSAQRAAQSMVSIHGRVSDRLRRFEAEEQRHIERERLEQQQQAERERREREARELAQQTQMELRNIPVDEGQVRPLFEKNDFRAAHAQLQEKADNYTTPEGKEAFRRLLERYRYLASMKTNLIKGMQAEPFPWGWGFGSSARDISGASDRGISVQGISAPVSWDTVTPPQMTKLVDRYTASRVLSTRERIEIAFGAAVYADLFGAPARDRARHYANRAMDLGMNRRDFEELLEARWAAEGD